MLPRIDWGLEKLSWLLALLAFAVLFLGPSLIGAKKDAAGVAAAPAATATPTPEPTATAEGAGAEEPEPAETPTPEATPAGPDGATVFADAGCGGCHTFAAAGAQGASGPNLDDAAPSADEVVSVVRSGRGIMPAFEGRLSPEEIEAVAAFVSGG